MCFSANNSLPANAITYNHRSEAMYRALKRSPENIYVKRALASGLENVRMLSANTPVEVRAALCAMHNRYHEGQSDSFVSLLDDAEAIMAEWDKKINGPNGTGLTTRNPNYESYLEAFVFKEKQATQWGDSLNFFKQTSVLNNHWVQFYVKEPVKEWSNANVDFTSMDATNRQAFGLGVVFVFVWFVISYSYSLLILCVSFAFFNQFPLLNFRLSVSHICVITIVTMRLKLE